MNDVLRRLTPRDLPQFSCLLQLPIPLGNRNSDEPEGVLVESFGCSTIDAHGFTKSTSNRNGAIFRIRGR